MADSYVKIVTVGDARPGMVLADNVWSLNVVLVSEGTVLSSEIIEKINSYNVNMIHIYEEIESEPESGITEIDIVGYSSDKVKPYILHDFQGLRENQKEKLKEQVLEISRGNTPDTETLFSRTDDMVTYLETHGDLFLYLMNVRQKNEDLHNRMLDVSLLCNLFGKWLNLRPWKLKTLTLAGLLSDIGKSAMDDEDTDDKNLLPEEVLEKEKRHALIGYHMLKERFIPVEIKEAALMHHERMDGSGYPNGLKDDQIPLTVRIVSICDTFMELTSDKTDKPPMSPFDVIEELWENSITKFDPRLLSIFVENMAYCYVGCDVLLSDGRNGKVVFVNYRRFSRPMVMVGENVLDLIKYPDIKINKIL